MLESELRRRSPAASPAWSARPTPTRCSTSPAWSRCSSSAPATSTCARLYPLGALDAGPRGRSADRDGGAHRSRLRRLRAGRRRRCATRWCCTARCSTRRPSATRSGCARRTPGSATASPPRGRSRRGSASRACRSLAETIALATIFELVRDTGARVHLCRLSSAAGVALVRAAKAEGLPVTCDVSINSLHLIDVDIGYFNAAMRLVPPLRQQRDRDAIRAALADGTIDALVSDHTPVDEDAKHLPFAEAEPGATGLELLLGLGAASGARRSELPLAQTLATRDQPAGGACWRGARCAGASSAGRLRRGRRRRPLRVRPRRARGPVDADDPARARASTRRSRRHEHAGPRALHARRRPRRLRRGGVTP